LEEEFLGEAAEGGEEGGEEEGEGEVLGFGGWGCGEGAEGGEEVG